MHLDVGVVVDNVDVDGEMSVDRFHLVLEALLDTSKHIVDVRADGSDAGDCFPVGEMHFDIDGFFHQGQLAL